MHLCTHYHEHMRIPLLLQTKGCMLLIIDFSVSYTLLSADRLPGGSNKTMTEAPQGSAQLMQTLGQPMNI